MRSVFVALIFSLLFASAVSASDWYVDGANGNDSNAGSKSAPLFSITVALERVSPGDTIHLLPTTTYLGILNASKSGTAGQPITITGDGVAPNLTKVVNNTTPNGGWPQSNFPIYLDSVAYVNIANLDVSGDALISDSCIQVYNSNHIVVNGNYTHGCGLDGISSQGSDYLVISNNTVHDNSYNTRNGLFGSGISTFEMRDTDSNTTDFKIQILNNSVYHNANTPRSTASLLDLKPALNNGICQIAVNGAQNFPNLAPVDASYCCDPSKGSTCCNGDECAIYGSDSDGSGIIIDTNAMTAYQGRTLIANNVIYNNGGRGIQINISGNVAITDNTVYFNNQDPYEKLPRSGEVMFDGGVGLNYVVNNILYSDNNYSPQRPGDAAYTHVPFSCADNTTGSLWYDYNLTYNDSNLKTLNGEDQTINLQGCNATTVSGVGQRWGNPEFTTVAQAQTYQGTPDFKVLKNSAAIGFASPLGTYLKTDISGSSRNSPITVGAYQFSAPVIQPPVRRSRR